MINKYGLACILLLAACHSAPEKENVTDTRHLEIKSLKLALDYPKEWIYAFDRDSNQANALLTLQAPLEPNDSFQENLSIYHEVLPMRLDDSIYHKANIREIMITNHDSLQVNNLGRKKFGEHDFNEFTFAFRHDQSDYVVHGFTYLKDSVGYNFRYTSAKNQEGKYLPAIHQILRSFKPL